ncbi:hypothetical protein GVN16_19590 [Emticicia sp. CRIBPO]|uniref:hypothetical protein n=1 Tax=Emticicia sp. CRIBPO TaxID=2683258 RepID=UPI001413767C|nr:hypothetical protein [Emticicia sp. CRIBPO]NBA87983.1 hypothetical protein [Emticicia sp. CRIBPO]
MKTEKHIGGNLYGSTNETQIIDYLADHKKMPANLNKSFVLSFMEDKNFNLILFLPNETQNKFMQFTFVDFITNEDTLIYMSGMFKELSKQDYSAYKPAQNKVDDVLYMLPTYRALAGYKKSVEEESAEKVKVAY